MLDLTNLDPATEPAGAKLNALMATEVIKLDDVRMGVMAYWYTLTGCGYRAEPRCTEGMHDQSYDAPVYKAREPRGRYSNYDSGYEPVPDYSTNPARAGELRRKADWSSCIHVKHRVAVGVELNGICHYGVCDYSEINGDKTEEEIKALAEALTICRAWLELLVAKEKAKGGE